MTLDDIEALIRKYLSTGIAVVVLLVAPGTGDAPALPEGAEVVTVDPGGSLVTNPPLRDPAGDGSGRADPGPDVGGTATGDPPGEPDVERADPAGEDGADDSSDDSTGGGDSENGELDRTGADGEDPGEDDGPASAGGYGPGDGGIDATDRAGGSADGSPDDASGTDDSGTDDSADSRDDSGAQGRPTAPDSGAGGAGGDDGSDPAQDAYTAQDPYTAQDSYPAQDPYSARQSDPGRDPGSGVDAGAGAVAGTGEGTTAAERHGWGSPNREDDFSGGTDQWNIYDGPGHAGQGTRSPSAVSLADGVLTITGDSSGTTGGMAWNPGQMYGRWEGRVKAPVSDESYNALLLLWPDAEDFPVGGEIDFMEMLDRTRQKTDIFVHYGPDNSQVHGQVEIDGTEWHNWAVEWTPEAITAYVDGEEWYRNTDPSTFPPGPMHLCIQLDWFPTDDTTTESVMMVDWVRQYSLDSGGPDSDGPGSGSGSDEGSDTGASTPSGGPVSSADGDSDGDGQEGGGSSIGEAIRRMFSW